MSARMLDERVVSLWYDLAGADVHHPLHVAPGAPHYHLWVSDEDDDPGTAEHVFAVLRDAAAALDRLADDESEYADTLEAKRDAMTELDGVTIDDVDDGPMLLSRIAQVKSNILDAARVRRHVARMTDLARDAQQVSQWAYVPPPRRPATYARNDQEQNTLLLRQRAISVLANINRLGMQSHGCEGSGFRVSECSQAQCDIATRAQAESDQAEPGTVQA